MGSGCRFAGCLVTNSPGIGLPDLTLIAACPFRDNNSDCSPRDTKSKICPVIAEKLRQQKNVLLFLELSL